MRYSFGYSYSATKPHQPTQVGDIHYDYDDNGNLTAEYTHARDSGTVTAPTVTTDDTGMSSMPLGIGIAVTDPYSVNGYIRRFGWNEENQLVWSNDGKNVVTYRYGADGERTLKYRTSSESLYFDSMWTCQTDGGSLRESKHIFVGQTRIATRLSIRGHTDNSYPLVNTYYYHGDHLGSAQTVTDYRGALYERLEYTPYGELWVEQKTDTDPVAKIPYRFTGKEYDTETGLYAFGARYLNPVTGMWISADPALIDGSFLPVAPTSDDARQRNNNLPGMGGVFNAFNFGTYSYSHHNPIIYSDPNGNDSGYAAKRNAVFGFGHAGMYVENANGTYSFYEVTGLPNNKKAGDEYEDPDSNMKKGVILSNSPLEFPTPDSAQKTNQPTSAGVVRRDYNSKEEMLEDLKKGGFTDIVSFNTTSQQDSAIKAAAESLGVSFSGYSLGGNHCGIYAENSLVANGAGIKSGQGAMNMLAGVLIDRTGGGGALPALGIYGWFGLAPNGIGQRLQIANRGQRQTLR